MTHQSHWAVILAGGDGMRLRPLTRLLTGDDRPKQFCPLTGTRSLLADTRERVARIAHSRQTVFVVSTKHAIFYQRELSDAHSSQVLEQPYSRGTTAAIAYAIAGLCARIPDRSAATVGFFPADHYFADGKVLRQAVCAAYATAKAVPGRVVLVGAQATSPQTDFGWIQPGEPIPARGLRSATSIRHVSGFWEKPSPQIASDLLRQGCLWNTFISVGRVDAFVALLDAVAPVLWHRLSALRSLPGDPGHARAVNDIYAGIASSDFSQDVLSRQTDRLALVELAQSAGWTDVGAPTRALDILARHNRPRPALRLGTARTLRQPAQPSLSLGYPFASTDNELRGGAPCVSET